MAESSAMEKNEVIERVFKENAGRIIYAIRSTGCPEQDVEDVLHQTMVQALIKFDQLKVESNATAWCAKIAINIALRKGAKENRMKIVDFTNEAEIAEMNENFCYEISNEDINNADIRMDLKNLLEKLSPEYKLPLLMKVVFGFSYSEIAQSMGIKEGTVKSRINRSKKILANLIMNEKSENDEKKLNNGKSSKEPGLVGDKKDDE